MYGASCFFCGWRDAVGGTAKVPEGGEKGGRGASCPGIVKGQLYRRSVSAQIPKRPEEGLE